MTLTDHEVAALRALADPAIADEPGPAVAWPVLEQVRTLVGADEVELDQTDPRRGWLGYLMSAKSHSYVEHEPDDPRFWDLYWVTEPCVTADRNDRGVTLLSDIYSDRQWRSAAIYAEYTRDTGLFHEMHVILPDPAGHLIRLHCWRAAGRDFTERQRFLLGLARPALVEAYRTAQARRHPLPDLTPRQLELLEHVGRGLTNRQVARELGLSEGTVRRHLNNIYERLGARSRTEAVTRVAVHHPR